MAPYWNTCIIYANPYHILRESKRQGYIPLVRDDIPLKGILVVSKGSPLRGAGQYQQDGTTDRRHSSVFPQQPSGNDLF